jgi:OOP family OmpA-OmpF porin
MNSSHQSASLPGPIRTSTSTSMRQSTRNPALIAVGIAMFGATILTTGSAYADDAVVNPDWADSAWYVGAGVGQSHASIDDQRLIQSLGQQGAAVSFGAHERDFAYKLYVGRQLNQYVALEAGYFNLGKFGFDSTTSSGGTLNGEARFRGVNVDLLGRLPLSQRLSLLGRVGVNYAHTTTDFSGNRLFAVTQSHSTENKLNAKAGLGLEYRLSEALAVRGEVERYRVNDAVGNRGDVDLYSVNLVYKFGQPARVAPVAAAPAPAPMPVSETQPAPVVAAVAAPVSEKVTFAAEALFDFDRAVVKADGKTALDGLIGQLQGMDTEVMITVGHTDAVGSADYNQQLSVRRAEAVKAYLVSTGIDMTRVYTEGKGKTQPVGDNGTAAGRASNRRVTVEVVGTRRPQ